MTSNRRQIGLLLFLTVIIVLLVNFNMYSKWKEEEQALIVQNNDLDRTILNLELVIKQYKETELNEDENGEKVEIEPVGVAGKIENIMEKFLSKIKQEEVIVLMESLTKDNNFEIYNFDFNVNMEENYEEIDETLATNIESLISENVTVENTTIENQNYDEEVQNTIDNYFKTSSFTIDFTSDYESVVGYIKRINDLNRSIFVKSLNIKSDELDLGTNINESEVRAAKSMVAGQMLIEVVTLNNFENHENDTELENITFGDQLSGGTNPFIPYNSYIAKLVQESIEVIVDEELSEIVITDYEKFTNVTQFEKEDFFFVGSPKDVEGSVQLNKNSYSGLWSSEIVYNFVNGSLENTANLVFDKEILVLEEQVEKLALKIFSPQYSYHKIGLVILDSSGKEHNITFSDGVYWTDWKTLEGTPDETVNYPAIVSRIYVTDGGEKSNLSGYYLFDDLDVLYTKDTLGDDL